jgi:leucyl aminopeptidase
MQPAYEIPQFTVVSTFPNDIEADFLVVPAFQDEPGASAMVDAAAGGELGAAFDRGEFAGKPCELWLAQFDTAWKTRRGAIVGVGRRAELDVERIRRMASCAVMTARQQRRGRVAFHLPSDWTNELWFEAIAEGATYANFDNGAYKSRNDARFFISSVTVSGVSGQGINAALERGRRVGEAANAARVLINEPGNTLTPREFVARASAFADVPHVKIETLD